MGRQVGRSVLPAPSELMQSQSGNFFTGGNKVNFSLCATQTYFPSAALTQSKGNGGFFFLPFFSVPFPRDSFAVSQQKNAASGLAGTVFSGVQSRQKG